MKTKRLPTAVAICLLLFSLIGCDSDDDDDDDVVEDRIGKIRVVNAIPDSPTLTVQINESFFANVSFGQASVLDERLAADIELDVQYSLTSGQTEELIDDLEISIDDEDEITVVLSGSLESASATVLETVSSELAGGEAEVHFFHGVTGQGRLDFYLSSGGSDVSGQTAKGSIGLGEALPVSEQSAGDYRLLVTSEGSDEVLFDSGPFELSALTRRLFVALDYFGPGDSSLRVVRVDPVAAATFPSEVLPVAVRVANLATDVPTLDTYVDDVSAAPTYPATPYAEITGFETFDSGSTYFLNSMEGDPSALVVEDQLQLVAGEFRSLVVTGSFAGADASARLILDEPRRIATESKLNIVHGAASSGQVDFYLLSPSQPVADADPVFGSLSLLTNGTVGVEPGTYDVAFTQAGEETLLFGPERITVTANGIYTLILAESFGGGTPLRLVLADDFAN